MRCVVYISLEARRLERGEILDILRLSRVNNTVRGITGVLLYHDGLFLQVLEGEDAALECLLTVLRHDRRHKDIRILLDEAIGQRHFPNWSMGWVEADRLSAEDRWLCRPLDCPLPDLQADQLADRIRRLVRSFQVMAAADGAGETQ